MLWLFLHRLDTAGMRSSPASGHSDLQVAEWAWLQPLTQSWRPWLTAPPGSPAHTLSPTEMKSDLNVGCFYHVRIKRKENRKYFHSKIFAFKINKWYNNFLNISYHCWSTVLCITIRNICHPEQNHDVNSMVNSVLSEKCTAKWLYIYIYILYICKISFSTL